MGPGFAQGIGDVIMWLFYIAVGAVIGFIVLLGYNIYNFTSSPDLVDQAVERGYALYCPDDGKFAWKGECDED